MLENNIETRLVNLCVKAGALAIKLIPCGMSGLPDRMIMRNGRIWFVELKAPGKEPRPLQRRCHREFLNQGFVVLVLDSYEKVERFVKEEVAN